SVVDVDVHDGPGLGGLGVVVGIIDPVEALAAEEFIIAHPTEQRVISSIAPERVVTAGADEPIVATSAGDLLDVVLDIVVLAGLPLCGQIPDADGTFMGPV